MSKFAAVLIVGIIFLWLLAIVGMVVGACQEMGTPFPAGKEVKIHTSVDYTRQGLYVFCNTPEGYQLIPAKDQDLHWYLCTHQGQNLTLTVQKCLFADIITGVEGYTPAPEPTYRRVP